MHRTVLPWPAAVQVVEQFLAIAHPHRVRRTVGAPHLPLHERRVPVIIFSYEYRDRRRHSAIRGGCSAGAGARVKKNVVPVPGLDSNQMRPPCRSTIRRTIASPIPSPAAWSACTRWKTWNILGW
jgi:hypothetical protein